MTIANSVKVEKKKMHIIAIVLNKLPVRVLTIKYFVSKWFI